MKVKKRTDRQDIELFCRTERSEHNLPEMSGLIIILNEESADYTE